MSFELWCKENEVRWREKSSQDIYLAPQHKLVLKSYILDGPLFVFSDDLGHSTERTIWETEELYSLIRPYLSKRMCMELIKLVQEDIEG